MEALKVEIRNTRLIPYRAVQVSDLEEKFKFWLGKCPDPSDYLVPILSNVPFVRYLPLDLVWLKSEIQLKSGIVVQITGPEHLRDLVKKELKNLENPPPYCKSMPMYKELAEIWNKESSKRREHLYSQIL